MWSLSSAIPLRFKEGNFLFHIVSGIWLQLSGLKLAKWSCLAVEVVDRDRRLRAGDRNLYPTHSGFDRLKPGVPEFVSSGLRDRFNPREELTAIALIDPNSGRC